MLFSPESLSTATLLKEIKPENRQYLYKLELFDKIGSTNTYLLECAKKNMPSGMVCLAEEQTAGRGRHERPWLTLPKANMNASLLWRFQSIPHPPAHLSLAVGVMVLNALYDYGLKEGLQLKWPNDILANGKKLGGILLESNQSYSVVIGVGLNFYLDHAKHSLPQATSIVEMTQENPKRNALIGLVLNALLSGLVRFENEGFGGFKADWARVDALFGQEVVIYKQEEAVIGKASGITDQGELLVQTKEGQFQSFLCGEVSVRVNSKT